jgi:hypothetical protein
VANKIDTLRTLVKLRHCPTVIRRFWNYCQRLRA